MFSLPQLHNKSLCVLALQNSQFEASTSSRPQTVNFEALGHKAIEVRKTSVAWNDMHDFGDSVVLLQGTVLYFVLNVFSLFPF